MVHGRRVSFTARRVSHRRDQPQNASHERWSIRPLAVRLLAEPIFDATSGSYREMPAPCRPLVLDSSPPEGVPISGLSSLWQETKGDARILIAILDGPLDHLNASLAEASIDQLEVAMVPPVSSGCNFDHGTEVASIIFGQHDSGFLGIAPGCRGLSIPIFDCVPAERPLASQHQLATAIRQAFDSGAQIINISAGQQGDESVADPALVAAVRDCAAAHVLVVAAVGNDGCPCLHIPAALPNVLAVGAMGLNERPLAISNWGAAYQSSGILAPGEDVPVAGAGGRIRYRTGSSYAAAIVSGVVGLLLSRQLRHGKLADPFLVREALLATAIQCDNRSEADCRTFLAGRLSITDAITYLDSRSNKMTDQVRIEPAQQRVHAASPTFTGESLADPGLNDVGAHESAGAGADVATLPVPDAGIQPSACGCRGAAQFVYALGQLGYDFGSEAGLDVFKQRIANASRGGQNPLDEKLLLDLLDSDEPWHAASLTWTLSLNGTPSYAIRPEGPFAEAGYKRLRKFLGDQLDGRAERIAVPGTITGQVNLMNGQTVPVINPDLRGLCNWTTETLIEALQNAQPAVERNDQLPGAIRNFLDRVYHEMQNAGRTSQERALNYAGSNLFEYRRVFASLGSKNALDTIRVERSRICRPSSDCWDITLAFFDPEQPLQTVRQIYRYTVDVSQVIPVTVGELRSWAARSN